MHSSLELPAQLWYPTCLWRWVISWFARKTEILDQSRGIDFWRTERAARWPRYRARRSECILDQVLVSCCLCISLLDYCNRSHPSLYTLLVRRAFPASSCIWFSSTNLEFQIMSNWYMIPRVSTSAKMSWDSSFWTSLPLVFLFLLFSCESLCLSDLPNAAATHLLLNDQTSIIWLAATSINKSLEGQNTPSSHSITDYLPLLNLDTFLPQSDSQISDSTFVILHLHLQSISNPLNDFI